MSLRRALLIPLVMSVLAAGCNRARRVPPPDVVGTWIAHGGRYDGRAITITKRHVILFMGGNDVSAHRILRVVADTVGDSVRVDRILYQLPGGGTDRIEMRRALGRPDVAHLRHAGDVPWVRSPKGVPLL